MGHHIDQTVDKQGAFAHVDEGEGSIWHSLGHPIKRGATPAQIAKVASLAWQVESRPVKFDIDELTEGTDFSHQVHFRSDTKQVLDVSGKGYVPHQNIEVLEFFDEYIHAGEMYIDTAGSLQEGRYIFVQAKITEPFELGSGDIIQSRVLLMNPHQYGKGMIAKICNTRTVCWNTVQLALSERGKQVMISHIKQFNKARRDEAKRSLGIARERVAAFNLDAKKLVKLRLDDQASLELLVKVFDGKVALPLEQQGRTINRLMELYKGAGIGSKLMTAKDTGWGLLNAVTQYYDHEYGRTAESRIETAVLGGGDMKKRELFQELLGLAA